MMVAVVVLRRMPFKQRLAIVTARCKRDPLCYKRSPVDIFNVFDPEMVSDPVMLHIPHVFASDYKKEDEDRINFSKESFQNDLCVAMRKLGV
jgi:hypothetical protein